MNKGAGRESLTLNLLVFWGGSGTKKEERKKKNTITVERSEDQTLLKILTDGASALSLFSVSSFVVSLCLLCCSLPSLSHLFSPCLTLYKLACLSLSLSLCLSVL